MEWILICPNCNNRDSSQAYEEPQALPCSAECGSAEPMRVVAELRRGNAFGSDRYRFDFGACSIANGYAQVDTKQDASYYGTWANPTERVILNYAEGDITRTFCVDDAAFASELRALERWTNDAGYGPLKVDPGVSNPELAARFVELGLADLLH